MAKCEICGKEMLRVKGCSCRMIRVHFPDGSTKDFKREKVGDEGWYNPGERCGDCGAEYGRYHHPGCDIEQCPACGEQALSCNCEYGYLMPVKKSI